MIARVRLASADSAPDQRYRPFVSVLAPVLADGWSDQPPGDINQKAHMFTVFDFDRQRQAGDIERFMEDYLCRGLLHHLQPGQVPPVTHYLSDAGYTPVHVFYWRMHEWQYRPHLAFR